MDIKRIVKSKSFYIIILTIAIILVSLLLLYKQDKQIEDLARQLYSPKSLIYQQAKDLKLVATCDGGLSLPNDDICYYFLIQLKIVNQTTKIQEFITYTCSVLANVVTNFENVSFLYQNCASNYPTLIKLKPRQQFETQIIIQVNRQYLHSDKKIKFGYIILDSKNIRDDFISRQLDEMRKKQESVIWSEPMELIVTSFKPFKIEDLIIPIKPIE